MVFQLGLGQLRLQQNVKYLVTAEFAAHEHRSHALVAAGLHQRLAHFAAPDQVQTLKQELIRTLVWTL